MSFHPGSGREVAPCHSPDSEGVMIRGSEARAFRAWVLQRRWWPPWLMARSESATDILSCAVPFCHLLKQ